MCLLWPAYSLCVCSQRAGQAEAAVNIYMKLGMPQTAMKVLQGANIPNLRGMGDVCMTTARAAVKGAGGGSGVSSSAARMFANAAFNYLDCQAWTEALDALNEGGAEAVAVLAANLQQTGEDRFNEVREAFSLNL